MLGSLADQRRRAHGSARPAKRPLAHALEGIKVLDLGNFLAGPFGPMLLGDLGATVYKLESPQGDQMRPVTEPFNGCQRGKLDVVVDLKTPEGLEIAHRLIREVDVVHHNMRPGVAERLGVDYETAKRLNPTVIYCHTTMWGNDGPRATWPGFDQLAQSSCGLEHELGGEGNGPNWYRFGMCDQACAVQSALAVLMALYWRERTGEGQRVDTSIVNGGVQLNTDAWIGPDGWSERPRTDQHQTGFGPLYRLYETSDGWIALACLGESHWAALAKARARTRRRPAVRRRRRAASQRGRARRGARGLRRRRAPRRRRSTRSTAPVCRSRWRRRTPAHVVRAAGPGRRRPRRRLRAPDRTGASASSATSSTSRRRRDASPDRRRCSASTRARCSPSSATPPRRSRACASAASRSGPTDRPPRRTDSADLAEVYHVPLAAPRDERRHRHRVGLAVQRVVERGAVHAPVRQPVRLLTRLYEHRLRPGHVDARELRARPVGAELACNAWMSCS